MITPPIIVLLMVSDHLFIYMITGKYLIFDKFDKDEFEDTKDRVDTKPDVKILINFNAEASSVSSAALVTDK